MTSKTTCLGAVLALTLAACGGSTAGQHAAGPAAGDTPPSEPSAQSATDDQPGNPLFDCGKASGPITATFESDVTLGDLVEWATGFTCKTIAYEEEAACVSVVVAASGSMTPVESWSLFVTSVESVGLQVVENDDEVALVGTPNADCPARRRSPFADEARAKIRNGIKQKSETEIEVEASVRDLLYRMVTSGLGRARFVPAIKDGKHNGFKIFGMDEDSPYAAVGLRNGDTLHAVNGVAFTDSDAALELATRLKDTPTLELSLTVQASPSSQLTVLLAYSQPVDGLQLSSVQMLPSSQSRAEPPTQLPAAQLSLTVQALPSSQLTVLLVYSQPVAGLQLSSVQVLPSSQSRAVPAWQPLTASQVSVPSQTSPLSQF